MPAKKPRAEKAPPPKFDKKYLTAARELRDRWMEQMNAGESERLLPSAGKYDVTRQIAGQAVVEPEPLKILPAA